jgi:Tfp pilus assembly protein PilO
MGSNKNVILVVIGMIVVMVFGVWTMVVPTYQRAAAIEQQASQLRDKIEDLSGQTEVVARLAKEVEETQARVEHELRSIPDSPDLAELMRKLSLPVDKSRVLDQTFTKGSTSEAIPGGKSMMQTMPLTVELEATFDSVFALLRNAESIRQLVRISTLSVVCKREGKQVDPPIVKATVGLEAVFEPPPNAEGR